MRFWDEMNEKHGFENGSATPDGIEQYRSVYIQVMNALLEKHNSCCRVIAYNSGSCHNSILWFRIDKEDFQERFSDGSLDGTRIPNCIEAISDSGWYDAIEEAKTLDVDSCVETTVTVNEKNLTDLLKSIK